MQQSSARDWVAEDCVACSHSSSQCLLVSTVFGTVSSLHHTSFFILVKYIAILKMNLHHE